MRKLTHSFFISFSRLLRNFTSSSASNSDSQFLDSKSYWETRYARGDNSGAGSYGPLAEYKANYISKLLVENQINTTVEFGCGDGNQLGLIAYKEYLGLDVSETVVEKCRRKFKSQSNYSFELLSAFQGGKFDLSVSLDVIYHLVENQIYEEYMEQLFNSSSKFVLIYSSDFEGQPGGHVRHRKFSDWIANHRKDYELINFELNPFSIQEKKQSDRPTSSANFFLFAAKWN